MHETRLDFEPWFIQKEYMTDHCHSLELIFLFFFGLDFLNHLMVLVEKEAALAASLEALEDLQDSLQRSADDFTARLTCARIILAE